MPDVLVMSGLFPKLVGAKVILDQHDPMPELMRTIYNLDEHSMSVRIICWLEKSSLSPQTLCSPSTRHASVFSPSADARSKRLAW